jgi:hypothetical protein
LNVKLVTTGAFALALLAGCSSRNIDTLDAVKQGVIRDISKNVNVAAMDVNVVSVSFRDKEADAVVSFAPKGGSAAQGLTMNYTLERKGSEWHIKSRAQSELQKHAAQAQQAPADGGAGAMQPAPGAAQGQLPAGHPALGGGTAGGGQPLPPGHPPLSSGSVKQ